MIDPRPKRRLGRGMRYILLPILASCLSFGLEAKTKFGSTARMTASGDTEAQLKPRVKYDNGDGVTEGDKEAVKWFQMTAEQGYAHAQYNLAWMYYHGEGVTQDYKEAVKWYAKAAEQGYAYAQDGLGLMYGRGLGVLKDYKKRSSGSPRQPSRGMPMLSTSLGYIRLWIRYHSRL